MTFSAYYAYPGLLTKGINWRIKQEFKEIKISSGKTPLIWAFTGGNESDLMDLKDSYFNPNSGNKNKGWRFAPVQHAYTYSTKKPKPGDLVHFKWAGYKQFVHVGIVDRIKDGKIYVTHLTTGDDNYGDWGIVKSQYIGDFVDTKGGDIVEYGVLPGITDP